jgi:hypothetical protein
VLSIIKKLSNIKFLIGLKVWISMKNTNFFKLKVFGCVILFKICIGIKLTMVIEHFLIQKICNFLTFMSILKLNVINSYYSNIDIR